MGYEPGEVRPIDPFGLEVVKVGLSTVRAVDSKFSAQYGHPSLLYGVQELNRKLKKLGIHGGNVHESENYSKFRAAIGSILPEVHYEWTSARGIELVLTESKLSNGEIESFIKYRPGQITNIELLSPFGERSLLFQNGPKEMNFFVARDVSASGQIDFEAWGNITGMWLNTVRRGPANCSTSCTKLEPYSRAHLTFVENASQEVLDTVNKL